jgi:hypothetical protein
MRLVAAESASHFRRFCFSENVGEATPAKPTPPANVCRFAHGWAKELRMPPT